MSFLCVWGGLARRVAGREEAEGWEGRPSSPHPSAFPLSPVADYNVLSHPSSLLVIILNVALSTLPVLALRIIHRVVSKLRPKVRPSRGPQPLPAVTDTDRVLPGAVSWGLRSLSTAIS